MATDRLVEVSAEARARVRAQVSADLPARVANPLIEQEQGRRNGATCKHDDAGPDTNDATFFGHALDAGRATPVEYHTPGAEPREQERAFLEGGRNVGDVRAAARVGAAAKVAE